MELEEISPGALSEVLSRDLQIAIDAAPELNNEENTCGNSSETVVNIVSYKTNEDTLEETNSAYETDTDTTDREEWLEEYYLHESIPKLNTRQKNTSDNEERFSTYRKTSSKEQGERKFPSSYYKLDKQTILALEKLLDVRPIGQYHEVIGKGKNSIVISVGESNIEHGIFNTSFVNAIKIYKLTNDENLNKAIYKRVDREYEHMCSLRRGWLLHQVPFPAFKYKNIFVMSIVGTKDEPAVPLSKISPELCEEAYDDIVGSLSSFHRFWQVHGNLCSSNVLIWRKNLFYVGWSKATRTASPLALENLMRDCCFVTKFFKNKGVQVMPVEALFKKVSKLKEISPELLDVIHKREPSRKCHGNPNRKKGDFASSRNCRFK